MRLVLKAATKTWKIGAGKFTSKTYLQELLAVKERRKFGHYHMYKLLPYKVIQLPVAQNLRVPFNRKYHEPKE